jgi:hypothetical protein
VTLTSTAMSAALYAVWPIQYMDTFEITSPTDTAPMDNLSGRIKDITSSFYLMNPAWTTMNLALPMAQSASITIYGPVNPIQSITISGLVSLSSCAIAFASTQSGLVNTLSMPDIVNIDSLTVDVSQKSFSPSLHCTLLLLHLRIAFVRSLLYA